MAINQIKAGVILNYIIIGLHILTGLLYTPYMLRCLGQNEYGLYSLVASVISYLTLLDFGFGSAIVRYSAKIRATGTRSDEWSLYGMLLSGYAFIGIFVTIGGLILYANVDQMFDRTMTARELCRARVMMAFMVGNLAVTFPLSVFGSIISAYEKFVFQRITTIVRILFSTAVLVAVLSMGYKAIALVVVQTIFSIITLLINVIYCRIKLGVKLKFNNFNFLLLKEIMIFSWWNFLGAIVDRIYWSTGQFILGIYCGSAAVAIYSVAIMLMNLYMSMSTSLNSVLLPKITIMVTKKNDSEISNLFIRTGRLQFCVLALILSGFAVFGRIFINLWAGKEYEQSFIIALLFYLVLLGPLIQNVGLTILLARGQIQFRSLTYLAISVLCLIAQILLAKPYGIIGCAMATVGSLFIGQWIVMNVYYKKKQCIAIGEFWKQIGQMAIMPIALSIVGIFAIQYIHIISWLHFIIYVILYMLIYLPFFFVFSMGKYERTQFRALLIKLGIKSA
ncbi:MAG: oligosaccharide flippase family protein [Prevotellaceae bacterium]|nr:oligosaccharide flippase family protein [Prevotellaceae bacterium]